MAILNVDKLVPDDKEIEFKGKTLAVPGSLPIKYVMEMMKNAKALESDPMNADYIEKALKTLHDIFKIRNPDVEYDWLMENITVDAYIAITGFLSGGEEKKANMDEKKN